MKHKGRKKARRLDRRDALRIWKGETRDSQKRQLYFGYGSNLNIAQMKRRCADSVPMVPCVLPDKVLAFSNVLTIEDSAGHGAVGAIYEVSAADERALDRYEGFPYKYTKQFSHVTLHGERRKVFYYVLNKPYALYTPTARYYDTVERGFLDWGLDLKHLEESYARALEAEDAEWEARKAKAAQGRASWLKTPRGTYYQPVKETYTVLPDGTIDYPAYGWDELSAEMEAAFQADYRHYAGW